ncbi:hypothetical protein SS50377_27194 [Spironucleus salmonicida]|uniref:Uncharacterized protein n=1 Tax=Spironucleus salmonicida TaxID=348837 RepID=A0A9P8LMU5_9EUKA|nr:hypothetical protein SS50377_27194 [Spironucleus salmonicida]
MGITSSSVNELPNLYDKCETSSTNQKIVLQQINPSNTRSLPKLGPQHSKISLTLNSQSFLMGQPPKRELSVVMRLCQFQTLVDCCDSDEFV